MRPVVVVPVHRAVPTPMESVSLRQCGRCLGSHEQLLLAPEGLDLGSYRELLPSARALHVEPRWMESRRAYNRLMMSPLIFEALRGYSHMLVHEPDAIVLRDELADWCAEPFDYIGAPWFEGFSAATTASALLGVGNFGLSLHRLEAARAVLQSSRAWYPVRQIAGDLVGGIQGDRRRLRRGLRAARHAGRLRDAALFFAGNCDIFWGRIAPRYCPGYRVAPPEAALRFAWEVLPERCSRMCGGTLPFGAHAWARYDLPFWVPHLLAGGVDLEPLHRTVHESP